MNDTAPTGGVTKSELAVASSGNLDPDGNIVGALEQRLRAAITAENELVDAQLASVRRLLAHRPVGAIPRWQR